MNSRKKFLVTCTALLTVIGFGFVLAPFLNYLQPNAKAKNQAEMASFDASVVQKNNYILEVYKPSRLIERSDGKTLISGSAYLIVKDANNRFHAYIISTWEGQVLLPNRYWGQHEFRCSDFGPGLVKGAITEQSTIKCHDEGVYPWGQKKWKWNMDGKNLGVDTPDITKIEATVSKNKLVLYAR